jgi:hydrogenase maturation factor
MEKIPVGKLPHEMLMRLLERHAPTDPRVVVGPGVGVDCAVLDYGDTLLVAKSDPITFTAEDIGWYAVNVNANDVATTGAQPRWFLATLLLPQGASDEAMVNEIFDQIDSACRDIGAQLVGGHTEITSGLDRPILCGTMLGEVPREELITPRGAKPGDRLLLTKGVPIEGTSILAADFAQDLDELPRELLARARDFLRDPGISVVREARAAAQVGGVSAMHDPTEGGVATGLWELAAASGVGLEVDRAAIHIPEESQAICDLLGVNPLEAIASGALLLSVQSGRHSEVMGAISARGIQVAEIGEVRAGEGVTLHTSRGPERLQPPARDAIAALFEGG